MQCSMAAAAVQYQRALSACNVPICNVIMQFNAIMLTAQCVNAMQYVVMRQCGNAAKLINNAAAMCKC